MTLYSVVSGFIKLKKKKSSLIGERQKKSLPFED